MNKTGHVARMSRGEMHTDVGGETWRRETACKT